ncbi:MAG: response regulator [Anaerosomatales bacterium]|nr:response regulator [Anaerosomatales bacterium]
MSRILVADDEPHILKLVSFTLSNHGYEVLTVTDGKAAVEAAERERPDLVLLDVMMPEMNGYEAARLIKENPATKDIPVVMLSAKSQQYEIRQGLDCGAEDYVCKPFTPRALLEKVDEILRQR